MNAEVWTANVLIVGAAADALKLPRDALDTIGGGGHITRTVLRSAALRSVRDEPLDLVLAVSSTTLLASPEFLDAFAARERSLALVTLASKPDEAAFARLRGAGVVAEHLPLSTGLDDLHACVQRVLGERNRGVPAAPPSPPEPTAPHAHALATHTLSESAPQDDRETDSNMNTISKTLEEIMKIDGAIGAALADWDSGLCLGFVGGGSRLNVEVAAAGNCQVVKAKMATMSELGIKGAIHDILITLDDQVHLLRPVKSGESLFLYVAIDKVKGNLGMARHRLQRLETELSV